MKVASGFAAAILAVAPITTALAATPSPNVDLNVLRTALAGAPDSSWEESAVGEDDLEGPFDAVQYVNASWSDQQTRDDVKGRLFFDRFVGGYGRVFYNQQLDAWIVEDVKAFPNAADAKSFWGWAKSEFQYDTANTVATPDIPSSFGDKYVQGESHGIDIYFPKATYVFTVTVGSSVEHLTDIAKSQASSVYENAPTSNLLPGTALPVAAHLGFGSGLLPGVEVVAVIAAVVTVAGMVALFIVAMRRRQPQPVSTISPDGNYWWDGTAWQPLTRP